MTASISATGLAISYGMLRFAAGTNEERPDGAIGQKTTITLLKHDGAASTPP